MSAEVVAMLIGVTAAMFLAVHNLKSHRLPFGTRATMIAVWVVIIAGLTFAIGRFAP